MDYEKFKEIIVQKLSEYIPDKYKQCKFQMVTTYDRKEGLCITNVNAPAPFLDLRPYYERLNNEGEIPAIIQEIINDYFYYVVNGYSHDVSCIWDPEYLKEHLYVKAVNYGKNAEWLKDVPHKRRMDLALIPKISVPEGAIVVTNSLKNSLGISSKNLLEQSIKNNSFYKPYTIEPIQTVLKEFIGEKKVDEPQIYVLSNNEMYEASSLMFETDILDSVVNLLGEKMVIIPSSVNEVLLVSYDDNMDLSKIKEMVMCVNGSLKEKDILSDNVYLYDSKDKKYYLYDGDLKPEKIQGKEQTKLI